MFSLGNVDPPHDSDELAKFITRSLRDYLTIPPRAQPVNLAGGKYPKIKSFEIDLSNCKVTLDTPPPKPRPTGKLQAGPHADTFSLTGKPIRYEEAAVDLELTARDVEFAFDRDKSGALLLMLGRAKSGNVLIEVTLDDLEQLLLVASNAAMTASGKGVAIKDVHVDIESKGKRSVAVNVEITARKFVTANIVITGELAIDESLNARMSGLACRGEGMVGSLVSGLVQPQLDKVNGKRFSLMAISLGDVKLSDVAIEIGSDALKITAALGS